MIRRSGMSSHCVVPYWNNQKHERQEQVEAHLHQQGNTSSHVQKHCISTSTTSDVPLPNYQQQQVKELTWENGQIAMHGLGGLLPSGPSKPIWARTGGTLESVVHQATCHTQGHNSNVTWTPATISSNIVDSSAGKWPENPCGAPEPVPELRKRARAESDNRGPKNFLSSKREDQGGGPSACASASATFFRDSDTTMVTWASFESPHSLKNKATDEDSTSHGCLETQDEDRDMKGESGRSNCSRRSRAAAVHNQSERRRRDRINQKMKALQKLVPNASKTDKASMLDEVIEYLKQLQAQVQIMNSVRNMAAAQPAAVQPPPQVMMPLGMQHQHLQLSLLAAAAARMGMGMGTGIGMFDMNPASRAGPSHSLVQPHPLAAGPTFLPPHFMMPHMVPAQSQAKLAGSSSSAHPTLPLPDPYTALLAQSNMELYNKMVALYSQQVSQATQAVSSPSRSGKVQAD